MRLWKEWIAMACLSGSTALHAQNDEAAWLPDSAAAESTGLRRARDRADTQWFAEAGYAVADNREPASRHSWNTGLDLRLQKPLGAHYEGVFSGRLDADGHEGQGLNVDNLSTTLRELYLQYRAESGAIVNAGRINLRNGVGVGFNPTDYLRRDALTTRRTEDPARLRENRLGTTGLQAQYGSAVGAFSLFAAPRIGGSDSDAWYGPRLHQTNAAQQWQVVLTPRLPGGVYGDLSVYKRETEEPLYGINLSTTLGRSTVSYIEWTGGQRPRLDAAALFTSVPTAGTRFRQQAAVGATYTTEHSLSVTLEYQYNGAGLPRDEWERLRGDGANPISWDRLWQVRALAQSRQEPATRDGWFMMAQWSQFPFRQSDLQAVVRFNPYDRSTFAWLEWRYNLPATVFSVSATLARGKARSEFGSLTKSGAVGLTLRHYF
ncbi:MAG: hypothetical protein ACTS6J_03255 [Burkholderiales bacterium]